MTMIPFVTLLAALAGPVSGSAGAAAPDSALRAARDTTMRMARDTTMRVARDTTVGAAPDTARRAPADGSPRAAGADSVTRMPVGLGRLPGLPGSLEKGGPVAGPLLDYMWVLRSAINSPAEVAQVVERARAMGVHGLLVQVVARGDAFYRSDLLPRAESLRDSSFDPLGELLPLARAAGLEVHAWMNCAVVWSGPRPPVDRRHVLNSHPEWVVRVPGGRPMTALTLDQRRRLNLEGVFLSPAHRGMRAWVARIAGELARKYPVDGIHLDYIREPGISLASDPMMRAGFVWRAGIDPERIDELPGARRASADSAWTAYQCEQVTAIVREVRDSLERVRPGLLLSAAVLSDTAAARQRGQAWPDWVRSGLVDRAFVMCYAPMVRIVHQEMLGYAAELGTDGRVVPGIAVYNSPPSQAAAKIRAAAAMGYPMLALYSYDSLYARNGYWAALQRQLAAAGPGSAPGPRRTGGSWTRR